MNHSGIYCFRFAPIIPPGNPAITAVIVMSNVNVETEPPLIIITDNKNRRLTIKEDSNPVTKPFIDLILYALNTEDEIAARINDNKHKYFRLDKSILLLVIISEETANVIARTEIPTIQPIII